MNNFCAIVMLPFAHWKGGFRVSLFKPLFSPPPPCTRLFCLYKINDTIHVCSSRLSVVHEVSTMYTMSIMRWFVGCFCRGIVKVLVASLLGMYIVLCMGCLCYIAEAACKHLGACMLAARRRNPSLIMSYRPNAM